MFETGDLIVHPRYGAGTIKGMEPLQFDGEERTYYCIELVGDQGRLMIPEERMDGAGLRTAIADVQLIRDIMGEPPQDLANDHRERQAKIETEIATGDPRQIIGALRDLAWRERHGKLTVADGRLKSRVLQMVACELALHLSFDVEIARERLTAIIHNAMQSHQAAAAS